MEDTSIPYRVVICFQNLKKSIFDIICGLTNTLVALL